MNTNTFFMKTMRRVILFAVFAAVAAGAWAQTHSITINNGQTNSQSFAISNGTVNITVPANATATYSGIISGFGYVNKLGAGKLIVTNANTVLCNITVNGGTLQIGNGSSGSFNTCTQVDINAGAILRFEPGSAMNFIGKIVGKGNVEFHGSNGRTLRLTADNTYEGTTTVEGASILHLGNNSSEGMVAGNIITNHPGSWIDFRRSNDHIYSGVISGPGGVNSANAGKTTLNGANTFEGEMRVDGNTLILGSGGSIEKASKVNLLGSAAKLDISAGSKTIKGLDGVAGSEVILGTRILQIGTSTSSNDGGGTFPGKITGNFAGVAINKYGTETLTLTGTSSSYTGYTDINSGILVFSNLNNFGSSLIRIYNGATLKWATGNTADVSSKINASNAFFNATFDTNGNNVTLGTALPATSRSITKAGTGTLTINASNTYTGETIINAGTLTIGSSGSIASSSGVTLGSGTTLSISGNNKTIKALNSTFSNATVTIGGYAFNIGTSGQNDGTGSYTGAFTGTARIIKNGGGTFTINGATNYSGAIEINEGTLAIGSNGSIATSSGVTLSGTTAVLDITAANKGIRALNSLYYNAEVKVGSNTLTIGQSGGSGSNGIYSGKFSGSGKVLKTGSGSFTIGYANPFTGEIEINDGTLMLDSDGTIENVSSVTLSSNTAKFAITSSKRIKALNSTYSSAEISLGTGRTLTIGTSASSNDGGGSYTGVFSGVGSVTKTGTATFTMSNANNTITGTFTHSAGTVNLNGKWAGNYNKQSNTTLTVTNNASIGGTLTLAGGNINMNLSGSTPSKLSVTGAVSASSGTNTINVSSIGSASSYSLITAASGLNDISRFALSGSTSGYSLSTSGTELKLTLTTNAESPTISSHPESATYTKDATATPLKVTASVSQGVLTYQWYSNSNNNTSGATAISGANSSSYTPSTSVVGTIYYYVTVTNTDNLATGTKTATTYSNMAYVTVNSLVNAQAPTISENPEHATYSKDATATPLKVTASVTDGGTLSYQWYSANSNTGTGTTISDATTSSYTPPTATIGTVYYYVIVTNTKDDATGDKKATTTSSRAKITVNAPDPVLVSSIIVSGPGGKTTIDTKDGTLQMSATVLPTNADDQTVTWSVEDGTGSATINSTGLLTAVSDGTVKVIATSKDGTNISGYLEITISGQDNTGIRNPQNDSSLKAWSLNGQLHVTGLIKGEMLSVYNLTGAVVYQAITISNEADITLPAKGVYVVRQGNNTLKVRY